MKTNIPSLKLTYDSTWKWMLGIPSFPFGALKRPILGGKLAVSFRECICLDLGNVQLDSLGYLGDCPTNHLIRMTIACYGNPLCIKQCSRMRYSIESCFLISGSHESEKIYIPKSWLKGQINQLSSYPMLPLFPSFWLGKCLIDLFDGGPEIQAGESCIYVNCITNIKYIV